MQSIDETRDDVRDEQRAEDARARLSHRHFLIFRSLNGTRYLFDAETSSVHPWPEGLDAAATEALYEADDGALPALLESRGAGHLASLVLSWRARAGAFRDPSLVTCECCAPPAEGPSEEPWRPAPSLLSNLMLVVTDECNLRCRYCIFSGHYAGYKTYRTERMSRETAFKAVDWFLDVNSRRPWRAMPHRKLDIAFFGGEPLLEDALIRDVVEYAAARAAPHYLLHFSMTTNLTRLSPEMASFLVERGIELLVSIDGPQAQHDLYRRDAADGPTFAHVHGGLALLHSLDPEYFRRYVRATVTLTGNSDLLAIRDFFESGDPLVPPIDFMGTIRDQESGEFHRRYPSDPERQASQYAELFEAYRERKRSGVPVLKGEFLHAMFEAGLESLYSRLMFIGSPGRSWGGGTCPPGRRVAVSTDGRFHICERINEEFPIGDVDVGLDLERVASVQQSFSEALPACSTCWARTLCTECFAQACEGASFRIAEETCHVIRSGLGLQLANLYTVLEDAPDGLRTGDPLIDRMRLLERRARPAEDANSDMAQARQGSHS